MNGTSEKIMVRRRKSTRKIRTGGKGTRGKEKKEKLDGGNEDGRKDI